MVQNTAVAYLLILFLSPIPNVTIVSYINKKPLLTKVSLQYVLFILQKLKINFLSNNTFLHIKMNKFQVVLDHHHKDMIFINWAMSTILICWMIFINLPGKFWISAGIKFCSFSVISYMEISLLDLFQLDYFYS